MSMKSVLMISPYFPPRKRVGSLRAYKFAKYLRESGYQPVIVCLETKGSELTPEEKTALDGSFIYHLKNPFDLTSKRSGSQLGVGKKLFSEGTSHKSIEKPPKRSLSGLVDKWFPIDTWLPVLLPQLAEVSSIVEKHDCKLIWSTGDPWSALVFSRILSKKHDLPWIADFRDPWTLCSTRYNDRPESILRLDQREERKIIRSATKVVFTAETTSEIYASYYPEHAGKFKTIYNSFDINLSLNHKQKSAQNDNQALNILFFGRFRDLSPASPIMYILHHLKQNNENLMQGVKLLYFGAMSHEDHALGKKLNVLEYFSQQDPVHHDKATEVLNKADLLLLSTDPGRFEIIPAKLWDYLPSSTPILSIAPNPEISKILHKTGRGVSFRPDDIAGCALFLESVLLNRSLPDDFSNVHDDELKSFTSKATSSDLAGLFDSILK